MTRLVVTAAEPKAARTSPSPGSTTTASEQTAITIAFRGPTFMNVCAPPLGRRRTDVTSSSGASAVRFTPRRNSSSGSVRVPRTLASSTSARSARSGGSASPAGEAVPRLPPIVPRFRICGEPTVRDASASAGSSAASGALIASVYVRAAPSLRASPSCDQPRSSASSARLTSASGLEWPKFSSTMTSVPPWIQRASGSSAFRRSASSSVRGVKTSTAEDNHRRPHGCPPTDVERGP